MLKRLCLLACVLLLLPAAALAEVLITEVCAISGTYTDGHAYDWVEVHNSGKKSVSLAGWYLSDRKKDLQKWAFPKGAKLKAGGYLTVYCTGDDTLSSGKDSTFYAPFKISSGGEKLYLSNAEGE